MDALYMLAQARGIRISAYAGACGLFIRDGRVEGVVTDSGKIRGDAVLVAAGAWSGYVLAKAGLWCPVVPVRGQMIWYQVGRDMLRHIVLKNGRYLIPRRDGVIIAGSTLEEAGFSKETTREAARDLHLAAADIMPALNREPIRGQWSGLRPRAPEGIPFIGPAPVIDRLFLSVGHFRNGLALAPGSARLAADLIVGRSPVVDPTPYDPVRRMAAGPQSSYNPSA
jgi:glycine oxidase